MGKKARGNGSVSLPHRLEDPSLSLSIPVKSRCVLQAYAPNPGEVDTKYQVTSRPSQNLKNVESS